MNTLNKLIFNLVLILIGLFLSNSSFAQKVISGVVATESGSPLENVLMSISGSEENQVLSRSTGYYEFTVPDDGNYIISACTSSQPLDGVTTLDIVIVTRHIEGLELIDSPYKIIAADVNQDSLVTVADTALLRQIVTGQVPNFPNNKSWRFIEESFSFPDPSNPFSTEFPEEVVLNNLENDTTINFIGLKIGDINQTTTNTIALSTNAGCSSATVSNHFLSELGNIKVFPNPFESEFNLDLGKVYTNATIEVYSSSGIQLTNNNYQNSKVIKLNLEKELAGIYFVKVIIADQARWVSVVKA